MPFFFRREGHSENEDSSRNFHFIVCGGGAARVVDRKPRSGYKVIFVPFAQDKPSGEPIDVLTGFVKDNGDAMGRPVGVAIDKSGALLVADDIGNTIWRVTGKISAD